MTAGRLPEWSISAWLEITLRISEGSTTEAIRESISSRNGAFTVSTRVISSATIKYALYVLPREVR